MPAMSALTAGRDIDHGASEKRTGALHNLIDTIGISDDQIQGPETNEATKPLLHYTHLYPNTFKTLSIGGRAFPYGTINVATRVNPANPTAN
jgi:hypothetical protein